MLKYERNQHYQTHHDYGADDVSLACGPRILTFFLYLSDVEVVQRLDSLVYSLIVFYRREARPTFPTWASR